MGFVQARGLKNLASVNVTLLSALAQKKATGHSNEVGVAGRSPSDFFVRSARITFSIPLSHSQRSTTEMPRKKKLLENKHFSDYVYFAVIKICLLCTDGQNILQQGWEKTGDKTGIYIGIHIFFVILLPFLSFAFGERTAMGEERKIRG